MIVVACILYWSLKRHFSVRNRPFGVLISLLLAMALSGLFVGVLTSSYWAISDIVLAGGAGFWLYFQPGWPALVGAVGYQVTAWFVTILAINIGADIDTMLPTALGLLVMGIYTLTNSLAYHRLVTTPKIEASISE